MTDLDTTARSVLDLDPQALLDNSPDNVRQQLGTLKEPSGFHLMRGSRRAVILARCALVSDVVVRDGTWPATWIWSGVGGRESVVECNLCSSQ